ncbi:MAG: hypothetical protein K0R70_1772, partial [Steroidobacteraceae bacterium]|nr:hypothetical protein [Steroidobacteraceae bacterium]
MRLYVVGILSCLSVTGCVAGGIPIPILNPQAPPQPASEVVDAAAIVPRDGAGAIVVTRDWQLRDRKCSYDISLDGRFVAGLRTGEQVTIYADPGARTLGVSIRDEGSCEAALAHVP